MLSLHKVTFYKVWYNVSFSVTFFFFFWVCRVGMLCLLFFFPWPKSHVRVIVVGESWARAQHVFFVSSSIGWAPGWWKGRDPLWLWAFSVHGNWWPTQKNFEKFSFVHHLKSVKISNFLFTNHSTNPMVWY